MEEAGELPVRGARIASMAQLLAARAPALQEQWLPTRVMEAAAATTTPVQQPPPARRQQLLNRASQQLTDC